MRVPLRGEFGHVMAIACITWAALWVCGIFNMVDELKGPAVLRQGEDFITACKKSLIITCVWCLLYYNLTSVAVHCMAIIHIWELIKPTDVTDKFGQIAGRQRWLCPGLALGCALRHTREPIRLVSLRRQVWGQYDGPVARLPRHAVDVHTLR